MSVEIIEADDCCCGSGSGGSGFNPACCCGGDLPDTLCLHFEWSSVTILGVTCASGSFDLTLVRCAIGGGCPSPSHPCADTEQVESCYCWTGDEVMSGLCLFPGPGTSEISLQEAYLCCDAACDAFYLCLKFSGSLAGGPCCITRTGIIDIGLGGEVTCDPFDWQWDNDLTLSSIFGCKDEDGNDVYLGYDWHITECA